MYINLESLSDQHVCIHHHMSRHLHQNVACLICQSHMPRLARDAIANGQVMIFRKLNAIWPRKARSWNNLVKVLGLWGISRTSFHGGYTQNLKLGGLTFWNMKHQKYHTRQLQSPVETGREESPWNRIPENYPQKKMPFGIRVALSWSKTSEACPGASEQSWRCPLCLWAAAK